MDVLDHNAMCIKIAHGFLLLGDKDNRKANKTFLVKYMLNIANNNNKKRKVAFILYLH